MKYLPQIDSPADLRQLRIDELQTVADEVRQHILETMSRVGGHTGASLGAVELAVAMHYVFETPRDRLVWDVGHQAYAHKILTGRRDTLETVKTYGGLSGFLRRDESEYDTFGAGHASTSLSAALGMAIARDQKGERNHVCALIGDSSLAGGMAMEAVNQAGHLKTRLIVLLNDNEMSIAPAVGALAGYLNRIRGAQSYQHFKEEIGDALESIHSLALAKPPRDHQDQRERNVGSCIGKNSRCVGDSYAAGAQGRHVDVVVADGNIAHDLELRAGSVTKGIVNLGG